MLFQIESMWQILGWVLVFAGLIITNEIARKTKKGGIAIFGVVLGALTVYFIAIAVGAAMGQSWALNNQTYKYMNGWFHYAKLYAACAGCMLGVLEPDEAARQTQALLAAGPAVDSPVEHAALLVCAQFLRERMADCDAALRALPAQLEDCARAKAAALPLFPEIGRASCRERV